MARRSAATMDRAHILVDRLMAQGVSVHEISRRAAVSRPTVLKWQKLKVSSKDPISAECGMGDSAASVKITWGEALDNAWDSRRKSGGREHYRRLLMRWHKSFADLAETMPAESREGCGCLASDLTRSPCPGHALLAVG